MEKEKFDFRKISKIAEEQTEQEYPGLREHNLQRFIDLWTSKCKEMCKGKRNYLPSNPKSLKHPVPVIIHFSQPFEWNNANLDLFGYIEPSGISGYIFNGRDCVGRKVIRSYPVHFLRNVQICEFLKEAQTKNGK